MMAWIFLKFFIAAATSCSFVQLNIEVLDSIPGRSRNKTGTLLRGLGRPKPLHTVRSWKVNADFNSEL